MNKFFITTFDGSVPGTLEDAKQVARKLEGYATVKHMGGGFCVETDMARDDINALLRSEDSLDVGYKLVSAETINIKLTASCEWIDGLMTVLRVWGGHVNYVAECYDDSYLDADILKYMNDMIFHY